MSLRLIEVILPSASISRLRTALEGQEIVDLWISEFTEHTSIARILVSTRHTEAVSDIINDQLSMHKEFRLMLFAVEATMPHVEIATQESAETDDEAANNQSQQKTSPDRISREELYHDIAYGAQVSPIYLVTVILSTLVAAVGLLRSNVAVIIGAMVIAPLLGPNVALSLASTLGDLDLAKRSIKTLLAGIATALLLALIMGYFMRVDPAAPEIASRTVIGISDVILALAAGSAGALAFTTGISATVIGVMVAVALLPPLVVVGLLAGAGHPHLALSAFLLFLTNIACINLAGVVTFLAQHIQPRGWWKTEQAGRATATAVAIWAITLAILLTLILWA
jgi:uncharacterized hydrophobic protein (TIGR00341 family)